MMMIDMILVNESIMVVFIKTHCNAQRYKCACASQTTLAPVHVFLSGNLVVRGFQFTATYHVQSVIVGHCQDKSNASNIYTSTREAPM